MPFFAPTFAPVAARLAALLAAAAWLVPAAHAQAPDFPVRPLKLVVANGAGSAPDILARHLGQKLGEAWGQAVVVDNRGAAGGVTAVDVVAKAPADGHQLLVGGDGAIAIMPALQKQLPYDTRRDLVPVVSLGQVDYVLVAHPSRGWRSLGDLVAAAKAQPGRLNYASAGTGSALHLGFEQLKQQAGFFATHIPYRGGPQGLQDVIAGQADAMFIALGPALPHIQSGKVVALAISGAARSPLLPQVPTVAETYPGYHSVTWFGLFAPRGTPPAVLQQIAQAAQRVVQSPESRQFLAAQGIQATGETQQAFARQVDSDFVRYAQLVQRIGLKAE